MQSIAKHSIELKEEGVEIVQCDVNEGDEDPYDWCRVIWAEVCVAGGGGTGVLAHQVFVQVALFHPPKEYVLAHQVFVEVVLFHQKNMYLHQRW